MESCDQSTLLIRNKCAGCYRQYNKKEHLVEHMRVSYHSPHEPKCGVCLKQCRSFESLREHLTGPLPKAECAKVFVSRGCNLCLNIFSSPPALRNHRPSCCQFSRSLPAQVAVGLRSPVVAMSYSSSSSSSAVNKLSGGCSLDGSSAGGRICICLVDESENYITFHTTSSVYPKQDIQRKIQDFLSNGEATWKIRSVGGRGKARILVGHSLDRDLQRLGIEYPSVLLRDLANYPPLMKTSKLSNSLKHLAQAYLGYDIQTSGTQDPVEDCVAAMRLYKKIRSQVHHPRSPDNRNNFASWKQKELEKMSPSALLAISASDYYCWCLDN